MSGFKYREDLQTGQTSTEVSFNHNSMNEGTDRLHPRGWISSRELEAWCEGAQAD